MILYSAGTAAVTFQFIKLYTARLRELNLALKAVVSISTAKKISMLRLMLWVLIASNF